MYRQNSKQELDRQNVEATHSRLKQAVESLVGKLNIELDRYKAGNALQATRIPNYEFSKLLGYQASDKGLIFIIEVIPKTYRKDLNHKVFYRKIEFRRVVSDNKIFDSIKIFDGFGTLAEKYLFPTGQATEENSATIISQESIDKIMNIIATKTATAAFGEKGIGNKELEKRQNTLGGMMRGVKEKLFYESNKTLSDFIFKE